MRKRLFWLAVVCVLVVGGSAAAVYRADERSAGIDAPHLASADDSLSRFWEEAAGSLEIEPEEGMLQEWKVAYDRDGEVLYQTFRLYVDRGYGWYDVYYYSQDARAAEPGGAEAHWTRFEREGRMPEDLVPAHRVFAALDRAGLRTLEQHQGLEPPLRLWFFARAGSLTLTPDMTGTHLVTGGEISPIRDKLVFQGYYGMLGIAEGAITEGDGPGRATTPDKPSPPPFYLLLE